MIVPLIALSNLTTIFGKNPKAALRKIRNGMDKATLLAKTNHILALNNISLNIEAGEIFIIMGLSGSGKSTLVRHINRLIDPSEGKVSIDGVNILELSQAALIALRRKRMSMVFQRFGLLPHRNVIENIAYGLEIRGVRKSERLAIAKEWLGRVGLDGYGERYPHQLSGGMQQRVGLARALAAERDIVLMDEPFSALDPLTRHELQDELLRLQKEMKRTVVFITHDFAEAAKLGSRIAILKDGEVVQIGAPQEILNSPANAYVEAFVKDMRPISLRESESAVEKP